MNRPIAYVTRFVAEYQRAYLENLNQRLNGGLMVFGGETYDSSFKDLYSASIANYTFVPLKNRWIGRKGTLIQNVQPIIACNPAVILVEEAPRTLSLPCLLKIAKRQKIGTLLWGHFSSNNRRFSRYNPLDRYRISLAKSVDGCVCYTDEIAHLIRPFITSQSCFVARNTIDTKTLFNLYESLRSKGKIHIRSSLGIDEKSRVIVFIGRLIPEKRPEVLLDLHNVLSTEINSTLIMIGDGPESDKLSSRIQKEGLKNVFMLGALAQLEDSAPWIYASDMMVCPGYVGLNVNHAFSFGLPVITCKSPDPNIRYHSPEIAYLTPGLNGMMYDYDDFNSLVRATLSVFDDLPRFSENAYQYAVDHLQVDQMVDGLMEAIEYAKLCHIT